MDVPMIQPLPPPRRPSRSQYEPGNFAFRVKVSAGGISSTAPPSSPPPRLYIGENKFRGREPWGNRGWEIGQFDRTGINPRGIAAASPRRFGNATDSRHEGKAFIPPVALFNFI